MQFRNIYEIQQNTRLTDSEAQEGQSHKVTVYRGKQIQKGAGEIPSPKSRSKDSKGNEGTQGITTNWQTMEETQTFIHKGGQANKTQVK